MPVVFDSRISGSLLGHLLGAISGGAITRKTSFLLDCLGSRVFARGVDIADDPHRPRGLRSRPYAGEGLPVSPPVTVADCVLATWLLDRAPPRPLGPGTTPAKRRGGK